MHDVKIAVIIIHQLVCTGRARERERNREMSLKVDYLNKKILASNRISVAYGVIVFAFGFCISCWGWCFLYLVFIICMSDSIDSQI